MTEVETPDESSRESRPLFIERYWSIVSTCQASSVPQLTGTEETEVIPKQPMPNAQVVCK